MEKLQLSAAEKRSVRIDLNPGKEKEELSPQAVGKLLSDRWARPEVVEQAAKGIECKDLGDNTFLIIFSEASGKTRALEEGPWMISKELVVSEFDGTKSIDEINFSFIPIWLRVSRLPMGLMNKSMAVTIGNVVGSFMEADVENGDYAAGRFLRLKVRLDIRKPLIRGMTMIIGEDKEDRWCPFCYEYLPDFCYNCGIIGHTDKVCSVKLGPNVSKPFGKDMRFIPPKHRFGSEVSRNQEPHFSIQPRRGGSGSWGQGASRSDSGGRRSQSDAPSWRKEEQMDIDKLGKKMPGTMEKMTSPPKNTDSKIPVGSPSMSQKIRLLALEEKKLQEVSAVGGNVNSPMQSMKGTGAADGSTEKQKHKQRTYKKRPQGERQKGGKLVLVRSLVGREVVRIGWMRMVMLSCLIKRCVLQARGRQLLRNPRTTLGCRNSPASQNEDNSMELPRVGERRDNSWPSDIQKEEDPDILFLSETKMDEHRIKGLRWKLGLTNMVVKDCLGRGGGLAIFWWKDIDMHVRLISQLYIYVDVMEVSGFVWRLTGFCGEPSTDRKVLSWKALRVLNAARRRPWLCLGDFNEILMGCEEGGTPRSRAQMDRFRMALEECELSDLGFAGDPYTW